jgi:hypothetical protein
VSVIAEVAAQEHAAPGDPAPVGGSFLDSLVVRLSTEHDIDPQVIRRQGGEVLASFAGARVLAFVPILVEKRLRETLRGGSGLGRIMAAHQESAVVTG